MSKTLIPSSSDPLGNEVLRVFVFFSYLLFMASCSSNKKEVITEIDALNELLTTEIAEDIEIHHTDSGFMRLILTSPKAITKRGDEDPYTEMPEGLLANFFNRAREVESTISAEYGISYEAQHLVILRNNVDVVNIKNERLNTEELIWNQKTRKIYTEKFVKITTPTEILTGYGLEADEDFSNWVIKNASGEFNLE